MKSNHAAILLLLIFLAIVFFWRSNPTNSDSELVLSRGNHSSFQGSDDAERSVDRRGPFRESADKVRGSKDSITKSDLALSGQEYVKHVKESRESNPHSFLGYQVEDGVAVVEGDIVLGEPQSGKAYQGMDPSQSLQTWPGGVIPFFIQGDLPHPERVIQALGLFHGTKLVFQNYEGQEDVLVFQAGSGNCKSYLGRVGGKQPLWVGPGCGPKEIAHEIMHAVGFIHEQNRADRDSFIEIQWNNIQDNAQINFEVFPAGFMKLSGLGAFDYESLMLYPAKMFSKDGFSETMRSRQD